MAYALSFPTCLDWWRSEMDWQPISESKLWDEINNAKRRMSLQQDRLWTAIRIAPQKWQLQPWGAPGNRFWAVAVLGQVVLWFNDIEDGFNCSRYNEHGVILDYWCNQDGLEHAVQRLVNIIETGQPLDGAMGPPRALD